ncbi:YveK family protein [Nigerium massiliense]|uniref:hypothetical protein n=1 Tax=Nigerium massiliense TaxID=1522317 RepID=UPI00058C9EAA|nr:hypothetical protein [Nigerium massiliense]
MDLSHVFTALARRWYLTLLAFVVAGLMGFLVFSAIGPTYVTKATSTLIPPPAVVAAQQKQNPGTPANPLLYLGGLSDARDLVVRDLQSEQVQQAIGEKHPGATVKAAEDPSSQSPLVLIESEAKTPEESQAALNDTKNQIRTTLKRIQDELQITEQNRVSAMDVSADASPTVSRRNQTQFAGLAGAGTLVVMLLLLGLVDAALRGREQRRHGGDRHGSGDTAEHDARPLEGRPSRADAVVPGEPSTGARRAGDLADQAEPGSTGRS